MRKKVESNEDKEPVPETKMKPTRFSRLKSRLKVVTKHVSGTAGSRLSLVIYKSSSEESVTTSFRYKQGYPPVVSLMFPEKSPGQMSRFYVFW